MGEEQSQETVSKRKQSQKIHPIAIANDKTDEEFIKDYLQPRYGVQPSRPARGFITYLPTYAHIPLMHIQQHRSDCDPSPVLIHFVAKIGRHGRIL